MELSSSATLIDNGSQGGAYTGRGTPAPDGLLVVETERFRGPLDLLLHLVRVQDIDIFDIPIARITEQFLKAIEGLVVARIDEAGEFLEMAALLVRIKTRMLLPSPAAEEDHDPRAELVRRLLEYEMIRDVADRLRIAESDRRCRFDRGYVTPRERRQVEVMPLELTWDEFLAAAVGVELPDRRDQEHRVATRTVALSEKTGLIVGAIGRLGRIEFSSLIAPWRSRAHAVMTLLAGLELTRHRIVRLRQREPFSPLWFYRGRSFEPGTGDMSPAAQGAAGGDEGHTPLPGAAAAATGARGR